MTSQTERAAGSRSNTQWMSSRMRLNMGFAETGFLWGSLLFPTNLINYSAVEALRPQVRRVRAPARRGPPAAGGALRPHAHRHDGFLDADVPARSTRRLRTRRQRSG